MKNQEQCKNDQMNREQNDYDHYRETVLKLHEYLEMCIKSLSETRVQAVLNELYTDPKIIGWLEELNKLRENIKQKRFTIMVSGEAKSGKSTLINAYLGVDMLPMDILQCTSAIVRIKHGKKIRLIVTYACSGKSKL